MGIPRSDCRAYLAVRLTGLRADGLDDYYMVLYEEIAKTLDRVDGLTTHKPHVVSNPSAEQNDGLRPFDIYLLDRLQVTHADIIVACIELPSFGVGAELQLASDFGIPVVPVYYEQAYRSPSRYLLGMPFANLDDRDELPDLVRYPPTRDGIEVLRERLTSRVTRLMSDRNGKQTSSGICKKIEDARISQRISREELAATASVPLKVVAMIGMTGEPIRQWARTQTVSAARSIPIDEVDEDRVLLPGAALVARLTNALGLQFLAGGSNG